MTLSHNFIHSFLLKAKGPIIMVFSSSVIKFCFFGISLRPTIDEDLLIRNRSSVGFGFPEIIFKVVWLTLMSVSKLILGDIFDKISANLQ